MSKPRIIILIHYLEIGGAEMSLIGLLQSFDYERVDVDLFVYGHRGELMRYIPNQVNLLSEIPAYAAIEIPMIKALRHGQLAVVAARLLARFKHTAYIRREGAFSGEDASLLQYVGDCVTPVLPYINPAVEYDLAISFLTPHNICRDRVRARKKVAWIHTDYSTIHVNTADELPVWNAFDNIVSISPHVTETFLKTFPSLAPKIVEIENVLSPDFVCARASEFDARSEMTGSPVLLSVGRYCAAKNYDNVPDIARRLVHEHGFHHLRWYIIGYGGDEPLIRQRIVEAGMADHVILLGKRSNPYPYIASCDFYLQPSRYEGKSVTVREAQILGRPVIVTDYPTARSQVRHGYDGLIVPLENAVCAAAIADALNNKTLIDNIYLTLRTTDFGNQAEVGKVYSLIP